MIATLDYAISSLRRAAESGYSWLVSPAGAAALVAEVERLRAEADKERAAVVAWLRAQRLYCMDSTGTPNAVTATYARAADAIERGEHRREEER